MPVQYLSRFAILFVCFCVGNNLIDIFDKSININAVSACALTDGVEMSSDTANAAETVLLEDFYDLRIFLNGFNDTRVFCNLCHYVYSSL